MSDMHVLYCPRTDHILAAHQAVGSATPTVSSLTGSAGLRVSGLRGEYPAAHFVQNWGTATTEQEQFWIPPSELAVRTVPSVPEVYGQPSRYALDTTQVAFIPDSLRLRISIDPTGSWVGVAGSSILGPQSSFASERRVWIQIEGPRPVDRRVIAGVLPAGTLSQRKFPITVDTDGPAVAIPVTPTAPRTYYLLILIEGQIADARTQKL